MKNLISINRAAIVRSCLFVLLVMVATSLQAAVLAQYDFQNYSTPANRASNVTEPNSTPSSYNATLGLFSDATDSHYINSSEVNPPASTLVEIANFTVDADPGYVLNLTGLDYSYAWFSKTAGSTLSYSIFANGNQVFLDNTSAGPGATGSNGADAVIDLSAPAYQGITSIDISIRSDATVSAADVIFRTVGSGSTISSYTGGEDLTLYGSVGLTPPPVPEPSSFLLLGLGAIGLVRRFRKKTRLA